MSMENAIMKDIGGVCYKSNRINTILKRLGKGSMKDGVLLLSYAGIPIYMVSEYDIDQIYRTIIDSMQRGGEPANEIIIWLYSQPMESRLRDNLVTQLQKSA